MKISANLIEQLTQFCCFDTIQGRKTCSGQLGDVAAISPMAAVGAFQPVMTAS
jgi:hypothetical protein